MGALTRDEVVAALVKAGARQDMATQYADAFEEYRAASENIAKNGAIVSHPRTGSPMENPYNAVRDRALKKLQGMRHVKADFLWTAKP